MIRTSLRTPEEGQRNSRELEKARGRSATTQAPLAQEHSMTTKRTFEKKVQENCLGFDVTLRDTSLVTSL